MAVSLREVFGVANEVLKSYVTRQNVDNRFKDQYELSDHHIVIFGETKVGKTFLRKKYVPDSDAAVVDCTKGTTLGDIYQQIIYKTGIELTEKITKSFEESAKVRAEANAGFIEFLRLKLSGELSEKETITEVLGTPIPNTFSIVLSEALKQAGIKLIVLDDFHYLSLVEQYYLSFDLKMFYQNGIRFIILGTKISTGYFERFNGELSQRVDYIDATAWEPANLMEIAKKGSEELNVNFSGEVINYLIDASNGTVAVYQMMLFKYCLLSDIREKQESTKQLSDVDLAKRCTADYWDEISQPFAKKLQLIASGERRRKLQLYYYILRVVLNSPISIIKSGWPFQNIFDGIQEIHPLKESVNQGNLTSVLNHIDELQVSKDIFPKLLTYYDKRLSVVDSVFYFFMKHFNVAMIDDILPPHEFTIRIADDNEDIHD